MNKGIKAFIIVFVSVVVIGGITYAIRNKIKSVDSKVSISENDKNVNLSVKEEGSNQEKDNKSVYIDSILPVVESDKPYTPKYHMLVTTKNVDVYEAPSDKSKKVGSVSKSERVMYVSTKGGYIQIKYTNSNGVKEGYVLSEDVSNAPIIPNNFNDLVVPSNVTKVQYGTSGQGRPLYYYKIGNGKKHILMNFAIHGYEDSWMQDGYSLTQIAEYLIKNLSIEESKNGGLNGWTFYIIPSANPDGLLDGYTNDGPGRCQVSAGIDMNRDFPGPGFEHDKDSRNKTAKEPLTVPETQALAKLVKNLYKEDPNLIVTDTHGWLDFTKGNARVADYFDNAFKLQNQVIHVYFGGYLVGYAKMQGAREVLIELPNPGNPDNMDKLNYNQKMLDAVNGLIHSYQF